MGIIDVILQPDIRKEAQEQGQAVDLPNNVTLRWKQGGMKAP